jgi:hypothetical protein
MSRLGDAGEWGLPPESYAPLHAELADHLHCVEREHGAPQADSAAEALRKPGSRRRLTATLLAEQVRATLHRKPSRGEWRELGWLLFWFALLLASDWVALRAYMLPKPFPEYGYGLPDPGDPRLRVLGAQLSWCAWLLQGVARAGFFATFAYSLYRAWCIGAGVLLGRLLQLKLVHTVLVIAAALSVGAQIEAVTNGFFSAYGFLGLAPAWLTAPLLAGTAAAGGLALWLLRRRAWAWGLALLLLAGFLYPGGPTQGRQYKQTRPYLRSEILVLSNGVWTTAGSYNQANPKHRNTKIKQRLPLTPENIKAYHDYRWKPAQHSGGFHFDFERNEISFERNANSRLPGHVLSWTAPISRLEGQGRPARDDEELIPQGPPYSIGPLAAPGAGLAWLAAPIPFLGAVGLLALLALMGRRGVLEFALYAVLVGCALLTTILPFMVGQPWSQLFEFSAMGMVHTPFPGFENLIVGAVSEAFTDYSYGDGISPLSMIAGLLLSAGIPWLLTALFLKPSAQRPPQPGPEVAQ